MNFLQNNAASQNRTNNALTFNPILIMPLPDSSGLEDEEEECFPRILSNLPLLNEDPKAPSHSFGSLVEKMETESSGNDEIETNNLNSSCALTILNKSSLNQSMELDNEVFYEVCEIDENMNIGEATMNFLKTLNKPFILQNQGYGFEDKNKIFKKKIQVRVGRKKHVEMNEKLEKRKGMEWEGEEIFLHKLKKLKV